VGLSYDSAGRVTGQTLLDEFIRYSYDANGNVTSITPPDRPDHNFSFTPVNLTSAYAPPDFAPGSNKTTLYTYNVDRQLTQVNRPDGQTVDLDYDSAGRLVHTTTADGVFTYSYDPTKGNLATIIAPGGIGLEYFYDGNLLRDTKWSGAI